jgi:hypothetical protein
MFESTMAGCMADGAMTAALAPDGINAAALVVAATATRLRTNLRILSPPLRFADDRPVSTP